MTVVPAQLHTHPTATHYNHHDQSLVTREVISPSVTGPRPEDFDWINFPLPPSSASPIRLNKPRSTQSSPATMSATPTFFSPSAAASSVLSASKLHPPQKTLLPKSQFAASLLPLAAAATLALSPVPPSLASDPTFHLYYGTAASAANYGGYGGNSSKQDSAEYTYEVPDGWKERLVSKVEKGTNGTDSEFFNPRKRTEREYLTFLSGIRALAPVDAVLGNIALSDVALQDQISGAESVRLEERRDAAGQVYYAYEIDGGSAHSLISVTCKGNKLYAHFVSAPAAEWTRDEATLRRLHESFKTVDPPASSSPSSF